MMLDQPDYPPSQAGGEVGAEVRSALSMWAGRMVDGEWGEA